MELGNTEGHAFDLQTERMLHIHTGIGSCNTVENTDMKKEPEFHTGSVGTNPCENAKYHVVRDAAKIADIKTEVIDNDYYMDIARTYNHEMCSNSNYIDTGMIRDIHIDPVKSEPADELLETTDHTEFIIEIDTCKDEYYETHSYPTNQSNVGESGVGQESGGDCVTKEDMHMKRSATQLARWALHTSVDTKPCNVVVRDIRYTYPETVNHGFVLIHDAAPRVPIHTQPIVVNVSEKSPQKQLKCSECRAGFTKHSSLKTHMLIQTGEKPHKCSICDVSFTEKSNLTCHIRTHTGDRPYKCSVCDVGFTQSQHLKVHKRIHTGDKPHTCSVCEVSFAHKGTLIYHMRTHTGEKPYKCTVCGDEFARQQHLKRHTRTHTGEKPHKCSVCEVSFSLKCNLTRHMQIHTGEKPYKCSVCGGRFTQNSSLKTHTLIHTGEKPHKCGICEVSFTTKSELTCHIRTHTGEKPHTCSVWSWICTEK